MLCDADDIMPPNALEILITSAKKYKADCVCGNTRRMIGSILIPQCFIKYIPPCFNSGKVQVYSHESIMRELYVSCFGINNFPVTLSAKLYKKELLTNSVEFEPIVHFMGEDLSITLRLMPNIEKLVIIPDTVYYYRMGGGTSKYMPYMLDDFLALYRYKNQLRQHYKMDSSVKTLIDIELMNIVNSYLQMCKYPGKYSEEKMRREIFKVIMISEIKMAAASLADKGEQHIWAKWILNKDVEAIANFINGWYKQSILKRTIKTLLKA